MFAIVAWGEDLFWIVYDLAPQVAGLYFYIRNIFIFANYPFNSGKLNEKLIHGKNITYLWCV
jgi:hypothetical protein